ncbi:GH-E family nuclease [Clostridium kluyveri]|uniref:LXG domain-containing protein n=1 Tax=Clostridium kluyveri TaxID=1534 RepID=A0A1L5FA56_CLOKL|nr:GH-E family nuclease [Clostridium kluyveri]APM39847.1 hypothetical protein BS101_14450 [Clostridium kluyveri]UZQ49989.1 GH-E family nuclease [Clostridium kluyveri]
MDFKLDIGELTNTINEYENIIKTLEEQKENINRTIAELTEAGWSGEAKDKFMEKHIKNQEFYTNLIEDIKYVKNALENEEKPRAVRLKKQSEDFVNCIKRSGGGAALTNDDTGVISLQYGGQFQINNNVSECIDNYKKMNSKFEEILSLANSLSFTSFPITDDVLNLQNSLKNQTISLTEFNDSFNLYCNGVRDMEENICFVFSKISGITGGISELRGVSAISENGQVDKNKVIQLMLKNPNDLTNGEKEILSYVEKILGEDEYYKLMEEMATFPDILYNKERDSGKYSIKSQNVLVGLSLKWFEAKTIEEKRIIEEEISNYRDKNPNDNLLERFTEQGFNNVLQGVIGQILLDSDGISEDRLNTNINKLYELEGQYIYNVLGRESSSLIAGITKRLEYVGRTPGKSSRTGKEVIERMLKDGDIDVIDGKTMFKASDGEWYELKYGDMAHKTDAVKWWNETGRKFGKKAPEVREWMLKSENYYLEHYSINRSDGAKIQETYLPPIIDDELPVEVEVPTTKTKVPPIETKVPPIK